MQDAYGKPGSAPNLGPAEKTSLDVIGYNPLASLVWNASGAASPADGAGTWTNGGSSQWNNGAANSAWDNTANANAQFGVLSNYTVSTTSYTVTLGSAITVGTLTFANGFYTINGGGNALTISKGILAATDGTINAPIALTGASSWQTAGTSTLTVTGGVSGAWSVTKEGPGALSLSGSNSYSGGTVINDGTVTLNSAGALPPSGNVTVAGGVLDLHGQSPSIGNLTFGDGQTSKAQLVSDSAVTRGKLSVGGDITFIGTLNGGSYYNLAPLVSADLLLPAGTHHITTSDSSISSNYDIIFSGAMSGPGGITKDGVNYIALSGANTYTGPTVVTNGYLFLAATNTIPQLSAVTVSSPGVLSLNPVNPQTNVVTGTYNQSIGSLAGDGAILLDTGRLTVGNDNTTATYSGTFQATSGSLTKVGTGTEILTSTFGYTLPTTINGGALQFGNGGTSGAPASNASFTGSAGGTLAFNRSSNIGVSSLISGGIGFTKAGAGFLILSNANTYTGPTIITAGILYAGLASSAGVSGAFGLNSPVVLANTAGAALGLNTFSSQIGSLTGGGTAGGNVDLAGATLTLGGDNSSPAAYAGAISSSGKVVKIGTGTQIFSGANSYTAGTTFGDGTLQAGSAAALGAQGTLTFSGGTLQYSAANTTDYSSRFSTAASQAYSIDTNGQSITYATALTSSGGSLAKSGAGALTLSATETYTGATAVTAGSLVINNNGATVNGRLSGTASVGVSLAGTLTFAGSALNSDRLGNAVPLTLGSGGALLTGGLSEGSSLAGSTAGFGAFTLSGGASLDFGTGGVGSTLLAASGLLTGSTPISIFDWTGTAGADSGGATNDRLLFVTDPQFTPAQLALVRFYNDTGAPIGSGAAEIAYNGFTELVAIPEPAPVSTLLFSSVAIAAIFRTPRRRSSAA